MRHRKQSRKPWAKRTRRTHKGKWVIAAVLLLVLVLCFVIVWVAWLKPEVNVPVATPDPTLLSTPTKTAAISASASLQPTEAAPVPTPTPLPEVIACNPGDTGEDVRLLQTMLLALGFDPGGIDGQYGAELKAAVRNFQMYAGLSVDGVAGVQTASALTQRWQAAQQVQPAAEQPLAGYVIGIDPGHQRNGNGEQEPVSPGSDETKAKVSTGTQGQFTGIPEYVVNLQVALKLKAALEALGAQVVMTRTTHDVDISNIQRAQMMNEAGVDCWLRIHANYNANPDNRGMFILVPPEGGLDTDDPSVVENSVRLAELLLENTLAETGAVSHGLVERSDQTGFRWSQVPVCNIEMGYMSNEAEDRLLVTEAYQLKIVDGLTTGFIQYFSP